MKKTKNLLLIGSSFLTAFILWTISCCFVDVNNIGANNTKIAFSTINKFFHNLTGVNFNLYNITDRLSIIPLLLICIFAIIGFVQFIKRKGLLKVDRNLLLLGLFYIVVFTVFIFFEIFVINYRPILINGCLEASYPSSTTMLVMCVIPTTVMQINLYFKRKNLKRVINMLLICYMVFMVVARVISGVHWISDIIGGILFSSGIVDLYNYCIKIKRTHQ